jgi:hypothetical protein
LPKNPICSKMETHQIWLRVWGFVKNDDDRQSPSNLHFLYSFSHTKISAFALKHQKFDKLDWIWSVLHLFSVGITQYV